MKVVEYWHETIKNYRYDGDVSLNSALIPTCNTQEATLSLIWHEGLVRDRSASRRVARMDIVTSTCTEKMIYMELAYTRHKLHQSHSSTIHKYHEEEQGPTTDENKRQKKNDVHPCYPRLPAWNPS